MLIDSGSPGPAAERDSKRIAEAMRAAGLTKITYLFTTHYDGDHLGGAPAADAVAHFERVFDHGEMDPKWEQNRGIEDRYKAYLAIAAGKRTIVKAGDTIPFSLVHGPSHLPPIKPSVPQAALAATERYWTEWSDRCRARRPFR